MNAIPKHGVLRKESYTSATANLLHNMFLLMALSIYFGREYTREKDSAYFILARGSLEFVDTTTL